MSTNISAIDDIPSAINPQNTRKKLRFCFVVRVDAAFVFFFLVTIVVYFYKAIYYVVLLYSFSLFTRGIKISTDIMPMTDPANTSSMKCCDR